jgi:hypothetical protein
MNEISPRNGDFTTGIWPCHAMSCHVMAMGPVGPMGPMGTVDFTNHRSFPFSRGWSLGSIWVWSFNTHGFPWFQVCTSRWCSSNPVFWFLSGLLVLRRSEFGASTSRYRVFVIVAISLLDR